MFPSLRVDVVSKLKRKGVTTLLQRFLFPPTVNWFVRPNQPNSWLWLHKCPDFQAFQLILIVAVLKLQLDTGALIFVCMNLFYEKWVLGLSDVPVFHPPCFLSAVTFLSLWSPVWPPLCFCMTWNVTSNNRQQCVLTLMWRFFLIPLFSCALPLQVEYEPGERVQETLRLWLTAAGGAEGRSSRSLSVSRVLWLRSYPRVCDKWHHRNFNFNPDKHLNSKYVNIFSLNETTTLKSPRSACRSFDADVK